MVTGTALSDMEGLGDHLSHHERYQRLSEFIFIVRRLLNDTRPSNFVGQYYSIHNLQLRSRLPQTLMPEFLIAGQSDSAHRVATEMDCLMMQMLPPNLEEGLSNVSGVNLGIFARPNRDEALRAAPFVFPDSIENREVLRFSMKNSDAVWKRRLGEAGQGEELHQNGYWLGPFLNFQADCPYLVGSYADVGASLRRFTEKKVSTIILDVIADEKELQHVCKALAFSGVF
jgi:alkanesulfonate monooxygenase